MATNVLLNNVSHSGLKVITRFGEEFGDAVSSVMAFPTEFMELQKEYPILFRKNAETNKFQAVALLGFEKGENLYLNSNSKTGWDATYIPAVVAKGPFLIGLQPDGDSDKEPVIHIDLDHPKVSQDDGYPLFLDYGGNSPYLEHIASLLTLIHQGVAIQDKMYNLFTELNLIEPVNIEIQLNNGEKCRLTGNYTINQKTLLELPGAQLERLNKLGLLPLAYAVIASLSNIRKLTEIKNSK